MPSNLTKSTVEAGKHAIFHCQHHESTKFYARSPCPRDVDHGTFRTRMSNSTKSFLRLSNATGIRRFGEQLTWIQEPDIFHMRLVGTLEVDDFRKILHWIVEWGAEKPQFFIICDVAQMAGVSADTRKFSRAQGRVTPINAVTIAFGASFALRVLAEMSIRARKAMGLSDLGEFMFVATQADALVEVGKRRAQLKQA